MSVTEEDFNNGPRVHDVYNLLDHTPLLSISGYKIGLVCNIEFTQEHQVLFVIFESFSTECKGLGQAIGQASGKSTLFMKFFEKLQVIDSQYFSEYIDPLENQILSLIGYTMMYSTHGAGSYVRVHLVAKKN